MSVNFVKEHLTVAEKKVLLLIGKGYTSQQVAEILNKSKRTVDYHLGHAYETLGVHNRNQALCEALRRGCLSPEEIYPI